AGMLVILHCTGWIPAQAELGYQWQDLPQYWWNYSITSTGGAYSFNVNVYDEPPDTGNICNTDRQYYEVQVVNQANACWGGVCPSHTDWTGVWNETVAIWSPQVIDPILTATEVTPSIVQIVDFSNVNAAGGYPNNTISYESGTSYTTTSSFCYLLVFVQQCSSANTTVATSTTFYAPGHNLVVTQQFWESGSLIFDAFSREWSIISLNYYQPYALPVNEPSIYPSSDTIVPGNASEYLLYGWGGAGSENQGRMVFSSAPIGGSVTVSSTTSSSQVKAFNLDVGVDLYGVSVATTLLSLDWSQTSSSTVADTLSWEVYGDSETVPACYVVYGVGGFSSSAGSTADAIGIWEYAPEESGGVYSCPVPA
ncbi:MAG TPA: hypothetical protein VEL82_07690, partial [Thermoplasmata archaeon]|nr:hypothetical protein [Thermoplasmata archaeon]